MEVKGDRSDDGNGFGGGEGASGGGDSTLRTSDGGGKGTERVYWPHKLRQPKIPTKQDCKTQEN